MFFTDLPKTIPLWVRGNSFIMKTGCTTSQWPVNHVAMSCNPTNVCGTPINIIFLVLKYVEKSVCCINHIAPTTVNHSFWLPGRARGVQDKQRVFSIHLSWHTSIRKALNKIMPPDVSFFFPRYILERTLKHDASFNTRTRL